MIQNTYKSGKEISVKRKKFEMITSHTARRSFATNMYHRGISPVMIMSITGHKKESTFLKVKNDSKVYFVEEGADGLFQIRFGDGVIGQKLSNGNIIIVP